VRAPSALAAWITLTAVAIALGALVAGAFVVLPALDTGGEVDPNLARAWVAPMCLRLGAITLAGTVVAALAAPRWLPAGPSSTLGLAAASLAILDRAVVLPRLVESWTLVDLARALPMDNMAEVERLSRGHVAAAATIAVLLLVLLALGARRSSPHSAPAGPIPA
jgi:hypothetical protein